MLTTKVPPSIGRIGSVGGVHEGAREGERAGHEARQMANQGKFGDMKSFRQTRQQAADAQAPMAQLPGATSASVSGGPDMINSRRAASATDGPNDLHPDPAMPAPDIGVGGADHRHLMHVIGEALEVMKTANQIARDAARPV